MTITTVFDTPQPSDSREVFDQKAFDTVSKLNPWSTQANQTATDINDMVTSPGVIAIGSDLTGANTIGTVAAVAADVSAVAAIDADVSAVAAIAADVSAVAANEANINAAVADLPALAAKVSKTGDTMTGHLSVPAGATGNQVPRSSEVVHMTGDETIAGVKTFSSSPIVPAGASGAQAVRASEAQWSPPVAVGSVVTTSVDFTSIPAGVNEIRICLNYLEASSGNLIKLRLGTSNGVLTTGYIALSASVTSSASKINSVNDSFVIRNSSSAGDGVLGVITLHRGPGNVWEAEGVLMGTLGPRTIFVSGRIHLSDESLTTLRIMSDSGGNFVGGAIYVSWRY